jgi:hypothetical protein
MAWFGEPLAGARRRPVTARSALRLREAAATARRRLFVPVATVGLRQTEVVALIRRADADVVRSRGLGRRSRPSDPGPQYQVVTTDERWRHATRRTSRLHGGRRRRPVPRRVVELTSGSPDGADAPVSPSSSTSAPAPSRC